MPATAITVSAWAHFAQLQPPGSFTDFLNYGWSSPYSWVLSQSGSTNSFFFGLADSGGAHHQAGCGTALSTGSWHLLTGTYDGNTVSAYLDGVLCATSSYTGGAISNGYGVTANRWNDGSFSIDDARIYNRALSAAEVQALYNAER